MFNGVMARLRIDDVRFSLLDFKLALRMLTRYPGLTIVACLAIAVAIGLGAFYFEVMNKFLYPAIPLDEGHRIVSIRNWERLVAPADPLALYDLAMGRGDLRGIEELGAAIRFERNLTTEDGLIEPVSGAEMTASAFRIARVKPLLGRALLASDEEESAPPAVVIGYQLWQSRFGGDVRAIGQTVKLGVTSTTVVGVMPEGFGFPVGESIWVPLRLKVEQFAAAGQPVAGAALQVLPLERFPNLCALRGLCIPLFGRLAPGISLRQSQAELDALAERAAANVSETNRTAGPIVKPYGQSLITDPAESGVVTGILYSINIAFALLLAVICSNVATLVFARTATRSWEITVRNALGATRGRIISQLFVEALVLASVGAVIGLASAGVVLRLGLGMVEAQGVSLPFWIVANLSPWTVLYAALLTLLGASIVGILPALRLTRQDIHSVLRREGSAKSGLQFGGFWTGVIVTQVAITVAFIPLAGGGAFLSNRFQRRAEALNAEKYLSARLALEPEIPARNPAEAAAFTARAKATYQTLEQRLRGEPEIEAVAFADRLPGMDQFKYPIAVDAQNTSPSAIRVVTAVSVAPGFFEAFGVSIVAGRGFNASDSELDRTVIVNQSFVHHVLEDRNPIGQRVRFAGGGEFERPDHWYEIVGMVQDLGSSASEENPVEASAVYVPITPGATQGVRLALRVRGSPEVIGQRLGAIAAAVDLTLRVNDVLPLARVSGDEAQINWLLTSVAWVVAIMILLLSATGIHALMAFTVARRTREIGIRTALGARPRRIVAGIFSRAFMQLGLGVVAGAGLAALWGLDSARQVGLLLSAVGIMLAVGMIACLVPLRRALRVDPTEALRREG